MSAPAGSTSASNLTGGSTAQQVWNYFTGLGYSKAATAGILGNMYQESGVNPSLIQGNGKGPAAGIVQWENYNTKSGRWKSMSDYAQSKGKSWTDLGSQLEFTDKELKGLGTYFSSSKSMGKAGTSTTSYNDWKNSSNVETATRQFEGAFERAGKPMMSNRISKANSYYSQFSGGGSGGGFGNSVTISKVRNIPKNNVPKKQRGGFGVTNSFSVNANNSSKDYATATNATNYINSKSYQNTTENILNTIVSVLTDIATNTANSSSKLDYLRSLKSSTTNNIITGSGSSSSDSVNNTPLVANSKNTESRNSKLAKKIAKGY